MDHILSSGSGRGRIAFFDLRANDYISVQPEALSRPPSPAAHHVTDSHTDVWGQNVDEDDTEGDDSDDVRDVRGEVWQHLGFQPSARSFHRSVQIPRLPIFASEPSRRDCFLQTGMGWLDHNHVYM